MQFNYLVYAIFIQEATFAQTASLVILVTEELETQLRWYDRRRANPLICNHDTREIHYKFICVKHGKYNFNNQEEGIRTGMEEWPKICEVTILTENH